MGNGLEGAPVPAANFAESSAAVIPAIQEDATQMAAALANGSISVDAQTDTGGGTAKASEAEAEASAEGAQLEPPTFEEQVEHLRTTILHNPRVREIEYQVLGLCQHLRSLRELEQLIAAMPEFKACGQNQYRILVYLEEAGGLDRFEIDDAGTVITEEMTAGLTEDEIDDLIADYAFLTTEVGRAVCEDMKPENRMADLMKIMPARTATYCEVLEFCQQPRTFKEIDALLRGRDILKAGTLNPMTNIPLQPSVFIDNLERAGGIVWDGAWKLTEGGRKYLEVLKNIAG